MVAETSYYANEKGKHGKNWHPPTGMHLMRGELLAYNYAHILADTIWMLQEDLKTMKPEEMLESKKKNSYFSTYSSFFTFSISIYSLNNFVEYKKAYEGLRAPIPENPLHLSAAEGLNRPLCYTNFKPHFNPKHLLDALVLGNSQWEAHTLTHDYSHEMSKYGYQDARPVFQATGGGKEIHIRLDNVRSGEVRVCGYSVKEALGRVEFYVDANYPFPADKATSGAKETILSWFCCPDSDFLIFIFLEIQYQPSAQRIQLTNSRFAGDDCFLLTEVPKGSGHVLSIKTSADHPHHTSVLSHVIIF
jgi:hypothetical protein